MTLEKLLAKLDDTMKWTMKVFKGKELRGLDQCYGMMYGACISYPEWEDEIGEWWSKKYAELRWGYDCK